MCQAQDPNKLPLSAVRRLILEQSSVFSEKEVILVPCHPDCIAMAYALKTRVKLVPLTGLVEPSVLVEGSRNTIVFERDEELRSEIVDAFSARHSPASAIASLQRLLCCLPGVSLERKLGYDDLRVIVMPFMDDRLDRLRSRL